MLFSSLSTTIGKKPRPLLLPHYKYHYINKACAKLGPDINISWSLTQLGLCYNWQCSFKLVFSLCPLYPLCFANEGKRKNPAKLMFCKTKKSSLQPFLINLQRNSFLPFSDKLSLKKNKLLKETILNYLTLKGSQVSQMV